MIEKQGNIFDTTQQHIGHGVNLLGLMGAGIAEQVKTRHYRAYHKYRTACMTGYLKVGDSLLVESNGKFIHNIASQDRPGPHARYEWVMEGVSNAVVDMFDQGGSLLALPEIGCGIGGLEWPTVRMILLGIERDLNKNNLFEVWHYRA